MMLCELCSNIDPKRLLKSPASNEEVVLGTWRSIHQREQTCDFCGILTAAIRYGPLCARGRLSDDEEFILMPKLTLIHHHEMDAEVSRVFRLQIMTEDYDDAGDLLLFYEDAYLINQPSIGHGRLLSSTSIDFSLIHKWISECEKFHEECNDVTSSERLGIVLPKQSMLIDVYTESIVDALPGHKYAALSYMWGDTIQFVTKRGILNDLRKVGALSTTPLTSTIRDAMTLTKNVGLRYLWVDALCIIQDDNTHKAKQIDKMHHIYAAATITIVAATSPDANSGLPGVEIGARVLDQRIATIKGFRFVARASFLNRTIQRSNYNTRAWTYQESCISRRLLYITSTGTAMTCCQGVRYEEMVLEDDGCQDTSCKSHTIYFDSTQRNIWRELVMRQPKDVVPGVCNCAFNVREHFKSGSCGTEIHGNSAPKNSSFDATIIACDDCRSFHKANEADWHIYKELVRGYTYRQMRYESDRIPAFAGIAGLLEREFNTPFLFGLPEKYLDLALTWIPHHNLTEPCRRSGLEDIPSWSWASHEIGAEYTGDTWLTSEVDWYRVDVNGNLRRVQSLKTIGIHIALREDFNMPVTMEQLRSNNILSTAATSRGALFGWCQVSTCFFLKGLQLCDQNKLPVRSPIGYVRFSNMPPTWEQEYVPVEVLCLSRSYHSDLGSNDRSGGWESLPHGINLLIISRQGNVATRIAKAEIEDALLWKQVEKEWMLVKLI
jgi:hypothetical protein